MIISLILAADRNNGIGIHNKLLCHLPADLKYFRNTTTGHHIVMGRKTYESVGRPLPNRTNIVVTRQQKNIDGCVVVHGLSEAVDYARSHGETELFITGGEMIFRESMEIADRIYLTRIHHTFEADTFFPDMSEQEWKEIRRENHDADEKNAYAWSFLVYEKRQASSLPNSERV